MTETTIAPELPPVPSFLPPLPAGAVYLGRGGSFKRPHPNGHFDGWVADENSTVWASSLRPGGRVESNHYAAPFDSEIVRLNQGRGPVDSGGVERLVSFRETVGTNTPVRVEVSKSGHAALTIGAEEVLHVRRSRDLRRLAVVLETAADEMEAAG
ncbi:hypothetical protein [Luteolibacter sp. LG18]|uniref:hypothetical protein n=1 Tax=Luteolibacter sp. LG18 TaxID=2819286 RepID=UPI002B3000A1|nr:hypothetical protein llg_41390 [Luteolibacter sp. LG18]